MNVTVVFLRPRLLFDGVAPYPKDLMLVVFDEPSLVGFYCWNWNKKEIQK